MAIHKFVLGFVGLCCLCHGHRLQKANADAMPQQQSEAIDLIDTSQTLNEAGQESSRVDTHSTVTPLSKLALLLMAGSPAAAFGTVPGSFRPAKASNANARPMVSHSWNQQRTEAPSMSMYTVASGVSDVPKSRRWWNRQRSQVVTMSTPDDSPSDTPSWEVLGTPWEDLEGESPEVEPEAATESISDEQNDSPSDVPSWEDLDPQQEAEAPSEVEPEAAIESISDEQAVPPQAPAKKRERPSAVQRALETVNDFQMDEDALDLQDALRGTAKDPAQAAFYERQLAYEVLHLLERVSGLDRGLLASDTDVRVINAVASEIETVANAAAVEVDWNKEVASKLDGRWRLAYTSAFASGSLGGARPGPPAGGPVKLGKIYQDIQTSEGRLINAIEPVFLDVPGPFPPIAVNVGLGHELDLIGKQDVRILGDGATIQPVEGRLPVPPPLDLQLSKVPFAEQVRALLPLPVQDVLYQVGGSMFRVTYMDDQIRITRGDRDELRVFVRDS